MSNNLMDESNYLDALPLFLFSAAALIPFASLLFSDLSRVESLSLPGKNTATDDRICLLLPPPRHDLNSATSPAGQQWIVAAAIQESAQQLLARPLWSLLLWSASHARAHDDGAATLMSRPLRKEGGKKEEAWSAAAALLYSLVPVARAAK